MIDGWFTLDYIWIGKYISCNWLSIQAFQSRNQSRFNLTLFAAWRLKQFVLSGLVTSCWQQISCRGLTVEPNVAFKPLFLHFYLLSFTVDKLCTSASNFRILMRLFPGSVCSGAATKRCCQETVRGCVVNFFFFPLVWSEAPIMHSEDVKGICALKRQTLAAAGSMNSFKQH